MRYRLIVLVMLFFLPIGAGGRSSADTGPAKDCAALSTFVMAGVEVDRASDAAESDLPPRCVVKGHADRRIGSDGKTYAIKFEMRLPRLWNGRFLFQGGGGLNGVVRPAIGLVKGPAALTRGFAVLSQNAGHDGVDASFGADEQARIDMIHRSYERATAVGKALLTTFYGQPPSHSYFMGCSEGGREAMLAAQRLAHDYDGVVAGDPGFLLGVSMKAMVDRLGLAAVSPRGEDGRLDLRAGFPDAALALAATEIRRACDDQDGVRDGLIEDYRLCRFDFASLDCTRRAAPCLTHGQSTALQSVFAGHPARAGVPAIPGYPYDTGIGQPQWREKIGPSQIGRGGVGALQGFLMSPYEPGFDEYGFDPVQDASRLVKTGSLNRTDATDYSAFRKRGGKILFYTGLSDPRFSAWEFLDYFRRLEHDNGGSVATADFARLFLVPGMTHCSGGQALDDLDPLPALVDWVEHGRAPAQLLAQGAAFPGRTRPICAYPATARYVGRGSVEEASSFTCAPPHRAAPPAAGLRPAAG